MIMRKGLGTKATTTIATGAIVIASLAMLLMTTTTTTTVVYAQTPTENMTATTTTVTNATTTAAAPTTLEFEDEPFAESRFTLVSENVINETSQQVGIVFEGSTTITMLPNTTETITTRDIGEGILTFIPGGGVLHGQVQLTTEDGSESAIGLFTEYITTESTTAISLARFITNSTGVLAPLNNMIAITLDQEQPDGSIIVRYFEWEESDDNGDDDDDNGDDDDDNGDDDGETEEGEEE
jgi:hypothetical protein